MPKKKDLNTQQPVVNNNEDELQDVLSLGDLGIDLGDDDLLITTEETITVITEDDEELLEDEEFLLGYNKKKNKKNNSEEDDIEDFDSYFYQEE